MKIDINTEIGKIIKKMTDTNNWKLRKEGQDDLDSLMERLK